MITQPIQHGVRKAFTLVELLIVILIIGILASILVPVISSVRTHGYAADCAAQINALRASIESYHGTYGAYPGPLSDEQMFGFNTAPPLPTDKSNNAPIKGNITGGENLVLGLLGGLNANRNAQGALVVQYDKDLIGAGPRSLNPNNPKQYPPFYNDYSKQITKGFWPEKTGTDSSIPEFVDRFPSEEMPLLYLRARPGAAGIMSATGNKLYQYDLRQILPYTGVYMNIPARKGLCELTPTGPNGAIPPLSGKGPNCALSYFRDPSTSATTNDTGSPRAKDSYILISPGIDRIYGTSDDITSFGNISD